MFGRYGQNTGGKVRFDRALTLGAEFGGNYWNRSADSLGVAFGWLRTSKDFRNNSSTLDANADGTPDFDYAATGSEKLAEIYYKFYLNKNLELTPGFQVIRQPGGDNFASTLKVINFRAKASF